MISFEKAIQSPSFPEEVELSESGIEIDEALAQEIWNSPERRRLVALRQSSLVFIEEALVRGVTKTELSKAIKAEIGVQNTGKSSGDSASLNELLFGHNPQIGEEYYASIEVASQAIVEKYPIFLELNKDNSSIDACTITDDKIDRFFDNYDAIYANSQSNFSSGKTAAAPCGGWSNFTKFAACEVLAGVGCGPAAFALCSWGCICMFCSSEFSAIC